MRVVAFFAGLDPVRASLRRKLAAALFAAAGAVGAVHAASDSGNGPVDRALTAFGRDHRTCRMWTDWRQLCARTGPGGALYCKSDPGFRVRPSTPFCVSQFTPQGTPFTAQFDTPAQRRSRNRFCDRYAGEKGSMTAASGPMRLCELYKPVRPFDGRRAEAIAHPLCKRWRVIPPHPDAAPGAAVGPATCVEWARPLPCEPIIGNANVFPAASDIVLPAVRDVRGRAVWGIMCVDEWGPATVPLIAVAGPRYMPTPAPGGQNHRWLSTAELESLLRGSEIVEAGEPNDLGRTPEQFRSSGTYVRFADNYEAQGTYSFRDNAVCDQVPDEKEVCRRVAVDKQGRHWIVGRENPQIIVRISIKPLGCVHLCRED